MNSIRSNNISLKYQRFTTLGSKDIEIRKSEFVAKTQFLCSGKHQIVRVNLNVRISSEETSKGTSIYQLKEYNTPTKGIQYTN